MGLPMNHRTVVIYTKFPIGFGFFDFCSHHSLSLRERHRETTARGARLFNDWE